MASSRMGVVIFGLGRAGQIHLRNVISDYQLELLYVVDMRSEMAQELIDKYNQNQCQVLHPDLQLTALNDPRIRFAMVCTPTHQHEHIVLASLNAGKAVFCEKPIAATEEAVTNCYDTAANQNVPLFCSFNRRFDPSLRKLYNTKSTVGEIQMVKSCARDAPLPPMEYLKISGGVYHDCLVHDIDLICWILGAFPKQVYAAAHSFVSEIGEMDDVDTVAAVMKFESGTLAIIDTSRDSRYGYDQRIEIFGEHGMLINNNQRANNLVFEGLEGASTGRMYGSFNDRYEHSYIEALNHFKRVIRGEEPNEITKEITMNVSKIASALEESGKSGQTIDMVY